MIKLLNAGFCRLRKSKLFWMITIFSMVFALFMIYKSYGDMKKYNEVIEVEQLIFIYSTMVEIVIAVFTSLFLGVEYSDGAIRNKISIGHKRTNIYLSNLIITVVTSLFSYVVFMLVILSLGIPLFGGFTMAMSTLLALIGCIFVAILAYASIFTFMAMLISNKTITAIASILLAFGLMMAALVCLSVLETQEYVQSGSLVDGEMKFEEIRNPKYPSETKKKVCQVLLDMNPAGQCFEIVGKMAPNLKILPVYSLGILVVFTSFGLVFFKKKELK